MCPKLSSHARLRSLFFCVYQDVLPGRNTREIEWFTQRNSDVVYRKENKAKPRQKNKRKKKDEIGQDGKKESIGHLHPVAEVFEKRTYRPKQEGKSRPTQSNPIQSSPTVNICRAARHAKQANKIKKRRKDSKRL